MKNRMLLISLISLTHTIISMEQEQIKNKENIKGNFTVISGLDKEESDGQLGTKKILFEGESKPLILHIVESTFNSNYVFSATPVFRYREENSKGIFKKLGDILDLSEDDINNEIEQNKWVYTPDIRVPQSTRLSKGEYIEKVGALILGTTDKNTINSLYFALASQIKNNTKKALSKQ